MGKIPNPLLRWEERANGNNKNMESTKEIRLCDKFYDDVPKMKEQIKEMDEKEKEEKSLKRKKNDRLIN